MAIALNTLLFVRFPLISGMSTLNVNTSSAFHNTPARRFSSSIWRLADFSSNGTFFKTAGLLDDYFLRLNPPLRWPSDSSLSRGWVSWVVSHESSTLYTYIELSTVSAAFGSTRRTIRVVTSDLVE